MDHLTAAKSMTLKQFQKRIASGFQEEDEEWRTDVGYRPLDKDMGFSRWCEITGTSTEKALSYIEKAIKTKPGIKQESQLRLF